MIVLVQMVMVVMEEVRRRRGKDRSQRVAATQRRQRRGCRSIPKINGCKRSIDGRRGSGRRGGMR